MTKQELLDAVAAKKGFHSIISDVEAPDNVAGDPIRKKYLFINHTNTNGTMGKTYVYYLHDEAGDVATFYNNEVENLDTNEASADQKKLDALTAYLKANFDAYFINPERIDVNNNWAEATAYTQVGGDLVESKVLVFKKGANPITHLPII